MASSKSSDKTYYSPKQAAEILAVSVKTIRRLIDGGELAATRVRRSLRISEAGLHTFIALNQVR